MLRYGPGSITNEGGTMEGRKEVKWKLKVGESVHAGDIEIEMVKRYGSGNVADLVIHAPKDTMVHRGKVREDSEPQNGKTISDSE